MASHQDPQRAPSLGPGTDGQFAKIRWWTRPTTVGFVSTASGFGLWLAFASEQADRENAGETVSAGVQAGVWVGTILLLAGLALLLAEGVRGGRKERRLGARVAGAVGLGLLGIVTGFFVMLIVVHVAFG